MYQKFILMVDSSFQTSSLFLRLYRPVCVGPGRKSRSLDFLVSWLIWFVRHHFVFNHFYFRTDFEYKDEVNGTVGFPAPQDPFNPIYLVLSDAPITNTSPLETSARKKREVRSNRKRRSSVHRRRRAVITYYDVSICDSVFTTSSLATR